MTSLLIEWLDTNYAANGSPDCNNKKFCPLYHHFTKNRLTYCRLNEAKKQINNNKRNPACCSCFPLQQMTEASLVVKNIKGKVELGRGEMDGKRKILKIKFIKYI